MEKPHGASPKNREMENRKNKHPFKDIFLSATEMSKFEGTTVCSFVRLFFKYSSVFFILSFGEGKDRQRSSRGDRNPNPRMAPFPESKRRGDVPRVEGF